MTKEMTCEEFFEGYVSDTYEFSSLIDEQYWTDGCNTEQLFDYMIKRAAKRNVELSDKDSWDYDDFFYNVYKETEKGLS